MIRHAKLEDITAIRLIATITWAQAYESMIPTNIQEEYIKNNYSEEALTKRINAKEVLVATEDDLIVAYAYTQIKEDTCYLLAMYVLPTHQRSGIGALLIKYLVREYKLKVDKIVTEVEVGNKSAENFYQQHNFIRGDCGYGEIMGHPLKTVNYELALK
ncbi:GNAT family N-acetyltransferase [Erysipelothrix urinaevulpis]|uniref:GNAT family N-acetyltransferase n=1 Tax=Erysipelothrix urinaevulpis TaxID=2683717 RepID=UPI001356AC11|nr:GNAT family N-acetyltransferase [Erysipelothrix urinaevulpis]